MDEDLSFSTVNNSRGTSTENSVSDGGGFSDILNTVVDLAQTGAGFIGAINRGATGERIDTAKLNANAQSVASTPGGSNNNMLLYVGGGLVALVLVFLMFRKR